MSLSAHGMTLSELIRKYLAIAGQFGRPAALSDFGLPAAEIERAFAAFDEDYQISRFLRLECRSGIQYQINAFPQTHAVLDAGIQSLL